MSVGKQTVYNPETKRYIVVGGRTHEKLIADGKMGRIGPTKEVTRDVVMAQKSPVKLASPKKKAPTPKKPSPKKRGRPVVPGVPGQPKPTKVTKTKKPSPKKPSPIKEKKPRTKRITTKA
jgi:hypothetical protein